MKTKILLAALLALGLLGGWAAVNTDSIFLGDPILLSSDCDDDDDDDDDNDEGGGGGPSDSMPNQIPA